MRRRRDPERCTKFPKAQPVMNTLRALEKSSVVTLGLTILCRAANGQSAPEANKPWATLLKGWGALL